MTSQDFAGTTLGHFRVVELIGKGGMGEVYRARDERLDRDVAIKVLPEAVANDPERMRRFEREAKALAALNHPNIATVFGLETVESGTDSDADSDAGASLRPQDPSLRSFLVMELLKGASLRELISKGGITTGKAVEYARAIADGLAAAHEKGIVHRDLKPENIFLTSDGRIKILDFGLAKLKLPEAELTTETPTATLDTSPGAVMGTMAYMAPEQVQGQAADHRSDIFALGVVLYEMFTGQRPFGGSTTVETAAAILKEDPEPIPAAAAVPPTLGSVVGKCLEKRPEDRFGSAHDLALTLGALDASETVPPSGEQSIIGKRWLHILAVVIAAVIALLVILPPEALFDRGADEPVVKSLPRIVVLPFENLGSPDDEYFADGMTEEITARLAMINGFRVISRTSAVQYAGTDKTVAQIGAELTVDFILEGTVRWARGEGGTSRIRVTPQLIRVSDDTHLWAETYDQVIDDVFEIQSEIAQSVTDHLGVSLAGDARALVDAQPTSNLDAYHAYLRGRHLAAQPHFTYENWERVMAAFQEAVELDPDFALAHAELARGHALLRYYRHDLSPANLESADTAARRALELAPESPRVHLDIGYYRLWAYRDVDGALAEFGRAGAGLPENAEVLDARSDVYLLQGRWDEYLDVLQRAVELSPRSARLIAGIGAGLWTTRCYPEAMVAFDQAMTLAPETLWPYLYKVLNLWSWYGDASETRQILQSMPPTEDDWVRWIWFWQEMFEGRYEQAIGRLESATDGWIDLKMWARPNALFAGYAYERLGELQAAADAYEAARALLEPAAAASPEDPRLHSSLGIVYAIQGRREDAVREGELACTLLPRSTDGYYYLPYVIDLAHIHTLLGQRDAAVEQLQYLLENPGWISSPFLRADPRWSPLKDDPRFQALLKKYDTQVN
ncbi:MAG: protein kinase [Acidobacteria bacterium]|nr:protein kinase [Acidobacteriota bacterium]